MKLRITFLLLAFSVLVPNTRGQSPPESEPDFEQQIDNAVSFRKANEDDKALEILYQLVDRLQDSGNNTEEHWKKLAKTYWHLSSTYVFKHDSLSRLYADKAIKYAVKTSDPELIDQAFSSKYYSLYTKAGAASELNNLADSCIKYSLLADNNKLLGEAFMHKCNALVELNRVEEADVYCGKAEAIFREISKGFYLSSVLSNIGNVFLKTNQVEKALSYHLKAFEISKTLDNAEYLVEDAQNVAEDYFRLGQYEKAARFYKAVLADIHEMYTSSLNQRFTEAEARFNAEQKDKEIALQKLEIAKKEKSRNALIIFGLIVFFLVIGFFQWRIMRQKRNKQLAQQQLRKEQEINALRKRLLENVAHEIRTPITLISGHLKLALEKQQTVEAAKKHIQTALNNSDKVLRETNEILKLLKPQTKREKPACKEVFIDKFLKRIFLSFDSIAATKNIKLVYRSEISPDVTACIESDGVETVINNFMSNAVKFSPRDSRIEFSAGLHNDTLTVCVRDFGQGIPEKEQQKIFNRFYQSKDAQNAGGFGIGLSLAGETAKAMGGKVWVESQTGAGAAFYFSVKTETKQVQATTKAQVEESGVSFTTKSPVYTGEKLRILIVEDNPEMSEYLKEILCERFHCDVAFDGIEGLQKVQTNKYSLIISDVMMPRLDGYELKKKINTIENYRNIPFVFLTAKTEPENKLKGFTLGVDDYIPKPFSKEELLARINTLLNNKKERDNWATKHPELVEDNQSSKEKLLEKVTTVINNKLSDENFKISELAGETGYSTRQLTRLLKQYTGLSPAKFVLEIRLQKAYALLVHKKYSTVSEVRNHIGMPSASHFNKKFTERFGVKPSELLKQHKS